MCWWWVRSSSPAGRQFLPGFIPASIHPEVGNAGPDDDRRHVQLGAAVTCTTPFSAAAADARIATLRASAPAVPEQKQQTRGQTLGNWREVLVQARPLACCRCMGRQPSGPELLIFETRYSRGRDAGGAGVGLASCTFLCQRANRIWSATLPETDIGEASDVAGCNSGHALSVR